MLRSDVISSKQPNPHSSSVISFGLEILRNGYINFLL